MWSGLASVRTPCRIDGILQQFFAPTCRRWLDSLRLQACRSQRDYCWKLEERMMGSCPSTLWMAQWWMVLVWESNTRRDRRFRPIRSRFLDAIRWVEPRVYVPSVLARVAQVAQTLEACQCLSPYSRSQYFLVIERMTCLQGWSMQQMK